jgi:hypothetical protein
LLLRSLFKESAERKFGLGTVPKVLASLPTSSHKSIMVKHAL